MEHIDKSSIIDIAVREKFNKLQNMISKIQRENRAMQLKLDILSSNFGEDENE